MKSVLKYKFQFWMPVGLTLYMFGSKDVRIRGYLSKSKWGSAVPVATRSKPWVCGRSPAETVDSNPTGDMDVCLL